MPSYELAINVIGKDRASGPLASVRRAIERIGEVALGVTAARALERIAEGFYYMGAQALEAVGKFQMIELTLQSLAARELVQLSDGVKNVADVFPQATQEASRLMDELSRLAILSPYQVDAVMYTYRMAMAFGYTTDEAMTFTGALTTMASGIGASMDMLERMAYNLAQVRLQGKVTALDIRQLALAGFDLRGVLKYVSTQMGYNIKDHLDFNKLIEEGKITWEDFTRLFAQYADENFAGASERMARSLMGLKSTFNDVFILTMPKILGPAVEVLTGLLGQLLNAFLAIRDSPILDKIGTFFEIKVKAWLAPWQTFVDVIVGVAQDLAKVTGFKWGGFQDGLDETSRMSQQYGGILGTIRFALNEAFGPSFILTAFDAVTKLWEILVRIGRAVGELFKGNVGGVVAALGLEGPMADFATTALGTILELFDRLKNAVWALVDGDIQVFFEALELDPTVQTALNTIWEGITNLWNFIVTYGPGVVGVIGDFVGRLLGMAVPGAEEGIGGFAEGFKTFTEGLLENGPQIIESLDTFLIKVTDEWIPAAKEFIDTLINEWIPAFGRIVSFISSTVIPVVLALIAVFAAVKIGSAIGAIGSFLGMLSGAGEAITLMGGLAGVLPNVTAALAPAIGGIGALVTALAPVALIIAAIGGAIALVAVAWSQNWGGFRDKAIEVWGVVQETLQPAFERLKAALEPLWTALQALWTQLQPILTVIAQVIGGLLVVVLGVLVGIVNGVVNFVTVLIQTFTVMIQDLAVVFNGIIGFFTSLWEFIVGIFTLNGEKIREGLSGMGQNILQIFGGALHALATLVSGIFTGIIEFVGGFIQGVIDFFVGLYNSLIGGSIIPEMLAAIIAAFTSFFTDSLTKFATWVLDVVVKVASLALKLVQVGKDIVQGLWDGIKSKWQAFMNWLGGAVDDVVKLAKKILGIGSPSKVFDIIGADMMRGWQRGIIRNAWGPYSAIKAVAGQLPSAATTITQSNVFHVQDRIDAEYVARRAAQLVLEGTDR